MIVTVTVSTPPAEFSLIAVFVSPVAFGSSMPGLAKAAFVSAVSNSPTASPETLRWSFTCRGNVSGSAACAFVSSGLALKLAPGGISSSSPLFPSKSFAARAGVRSFPPWGGEEAEEEEELTIVFRGAPYAFPLCPFWNSIGTSLRVAVIEMAGTGTVWTGCFAALSTRGRAAVSSFAVTTVGMPFVSASFDEAEEGEAAAIAALLPKVPDEVEGPRGGETAESPAEPRRAAAPAFAARASPFESSGVGFVEVGSSFGPSTSVTVVI